MSCVVLDEPSSASRSLLTSNSGIRFGNLWLNTAAFPSTITKSTILSRDDEDCVFLRRLAAVPVVARYLQRMSTRESPPILPSLESATVSPDISRHNPEHYVPFRDLPRVEILHANDQLVETGGSIVRFNLQEGEVIRPISLVSRRDRRLSAFQ